MQAIVCVWVYDCRNPLRFAFVFAECVTVGGVRTMKHTRFVSTEYGVRVWLCVLGVTSWTLIGTDCPQTAVFSTNGIFPFVFGNRLTVYYDGEVFNKFLAC